MYNVVSKFPYLTVEMSNYQLSATIEYQHVILDGHTILLISWVCNKLLLIMILV